MKQWRTSELEKFWNDVFEGKEDIKKKKKEKRGDQTQERYRNKWETYFRNED